MEPEKRRIHTAKLATVLIAMALVAVITFQNLHLDKVQFQVLFWQPSIAPVLLVAVLTVVGFVAGYFVATFRRTHKSE